VRIGTRAAAMRVSPLCRWIADLPTFNVRLHIVVRDGGEIVAHDAEQVSFLDSARGRDPRGSTRLAARPGNAVDRHVRHLGDDRVTNLTGSVRSAATPIDALRPRVIARLGRARRARSL